MPSTRTTFSLLLLALSPSLAFARQGVQNPALLTTLHNLSNCTDGVCGTLAGNAVTPLLAASDQCAQQDQADEIIDAAAAQSSDVGKQMIQLAIQYRKLERNTPPIPGSGVNLNSVFCQRAPKHSQLNGLIQAQDPTADPQLFFDPKVQGNNSVVVKGSQANTFPFGQSDSTNSTTTDSSDNGDDPDCSDEGDDTPTATAAGAIAGGQAEETQTVHVTQTITQVVTQTADALATASDPGVAAAVTSVAVGQGSASGQFITLGGASATSSGAPAVATASSTSSAEDPNASAAANGSNTSGGVGATVLGFGNSGDASTGADGVAAAQPGTGSTTGGVGADVLGFGAPVSATKKMRKVRRHHAPSLQHYYFPRQAEENGAGVGAEVLSSFEIPASSVTPQPSGAGVGAQVVSSGFISGVPSASSAPAVAVAASSDVPGSGGVGAVFVSSGVIAASSTNGAAAAAVTTAGRNLGPFIALPPVSASAST